MKTGKNSPMVITVMILLSSLTSMSQSFNDPGNQWNTRFSAGWSFYNTEIFRFSGDTMIMNTFYNKLYMTRDSTSGASWNYAGAIREWEGRVYTYLPGSFEEGLLYDYTLEAGDTAFIINDWCREPFPIVCVSTDSIGINGSNRKTLLFEFPYSQWIEGIGSLQGPIYSGIDYCVTDVYYDLLCYYNNDKLLYINPSANSCYETNVGIYNIVVDKKLTIFPNPSTGVLNLDIVNSGKNLPVCLEIRNSTGILVFHDLNYLDFGKSIDLSALPDGIYSVCIKNDDDSFAGQFIICH
ncbi:MAG: T9SS type A sorting domain-containing protein [Bacteroidota bacterium]